MSCGVGGRRGPDLAWLWLWWRPVAAAPIGPLAWEPPCAAGAALKRQKKAGRKSGPPDPRSPGAGEAEARFSCLRIAQVLPEPVPPLASPRTFGDTQDRNDVEGLGVRRPLRAPGARDRYAPAVTANTQRSGPIGRWRGREERGRGRTRGFECNRGARASGVAASAPVWKGPQQRVRADFQDGARTARPGHGAGHRAEARPPGGPSQGRASLIRKMGLFYDGKLNVSPETSMIRTRDGSDFRGPNGAPQPEASFPGRSEKLLQRSRVWGRFVSAQSKEPKAGQGPAPRRFPKNQSRVRSALAPGGSLPLEGAPARRPRERAFSLR